MVARLTLGRGRWLSYVLTVLGVFVAVGVVLSLTGGLSLTLGVVYFACVAAMALDFLVLDVFEVETDQETAHAKSLLWSYDLDLRSITSVRRSAWPLLFGMRVYRVRFMDPHRGQRRLKILSTGDPSDVLGGGSAVRPS
jgi:hypothetical protein